jgi:hypothetical protein
MNFTPKLRVGPIAGGALIVAAVGLIGPARHVAPVPIVATQNSFAAPESYQPYHLAPIISAVDVAPALGVESVKPDYYLPVTHWYNSKHWWKRNAPIVGGAAGGALVGGLVGGGTGAVVGGAVGAGGGYIYKRSTHHHHYEEHYQHHR